MERDQPLNVYISATSRGLLREREVITDLVTGIGLRTWDFESIAAASPESSIYQLCYNEMMRADIFIGIYAHYYGWIPEKDRFGVDTSDGERSLIHMEYQWALERKIPMLLFFLARYDKEGKEILVPDNEREQDDERQLKLNHFKDEIRRAKYVYEFRSTDNLRRLVGVALVKTVHAMLFGGKVDQLVFISHSTKDDAFVDQLAERLHCCGVTTWIDHHNILPGADWDTALESALHASDALIVVLTPASNRSIVVKAEWSYFGESGKKIYPLLLGNTGIPFRLRVLQYTDFQTDPVKAFRRLKDALGVAQCTAEWAEP